MTEYSGWMKDDLVTELHTRGLDATGTKADLVQRLTEDDAAGEAVEAVPVEQVTEPLPDPEPPAAEPAPEEPAPEEAEEPRRAFPGEAAETTETITYTAVPGPQLPGLFGGVDTS